MDINGSPIIPGSIIVCPRDQARYVPPPPPVEPADAASLVRSPKGKPRSPRVTSPRKREDNSNISSPASPSLSNAHRLEEATPRHSTRADSRQVSRKPNLARSDSSLEKQSPCNGVVRSSKSTLASPSPSPRATKGSNDRQRAAKGRMNADFEATTKRIKTKFEEQHGDCVIMVVGVNGLRPRKPLGSRALEGCCIVVSIELDSGKAFHTHYSIQANPDTKRHKIT